MNQKPRIVTTSWDDGDPADLRVAELLRARGLPATFYVPMVGYRGRATIGIAEMRMLKSQGFEFGAHGVSHRTLLDLPPAEIEREVRESKATLEDRLDCQVGMFCYPRGRFDHQVMKQVEAAGYQGARTTRMLSTRLDFDFFEMPTSLQVFPHTDWTYFRNIAKAKDPGRMFEFLRQFRGQPNWITLGKRLFDCVLKDGGIWHLYGHSWEIEEHALWEGLAELLDYVSNRAGVAYLSNGGAQGLCSSLERPVEFRGEICEPQDSARS